MLIHVVVINDEIQKAYMIRQDAEMYIKQMYDEEKWLVEKEIKTEIID